MLVYATRLCFTPSTGLRQPLNVVARWLTRKSGRRLTGGQLASGIDGTSAGGHQVRSVAALGEFPELVSIAYSHPDSKVSGRRWTTEIGLGQRDASADVDCTVVCRTSEISSRVSEPVEASRPGVVVELAAACPLSNATQGTRRHTLDEESAEAFRYVVLDGQRQYCLVVLSPDDTSSFHADVEQLRSLLLGLADIVVIPPGTDTAVLARAVGAEYVPYRGAIRLIYPEARIPGRPPIASRVLTTDDIAALTQRGRKVEGEILSLVVHRSNLPLSRLHISPERTREAQLLRELRAKREQAAESGDLREYVALQDEHIKNLEVQVKSQQSEIEEFGQLFDAQEDTARDLRFDNEALKAHLQELSQSPRGPQGGARDEEHLLRSVADWGGNPQPDQALAMLEHFLPMRVRVLPDAWEAAKESKGFKYGERLFELLVLLGTDYWAALASGKPDAEARKVFGKSYAAKESETVEKNPGARARRTFSFNGRQYEMMRHLKIGTKDSAAETIRVHFEWVSQDRVIVIGYCGPHIPFR